MRNEVRERRAAKGLAQGELARELDVSRQTINSIETGRYTPSLQLAIAIARFFGTTVEEIFHADHSLGRTAGVTGPRWPSAQPSASST